MLKIQYLLCDDVIGEICKYMDVVDLSFVKQFNGIKWSGLSRKTFTPITFFEQYRYKMDWYNLCGNTSIPVSFFKKHVDKINWFVIHPYHCPFLNNMQIK